MKLIVGLGNPGEKYANNRHNAGFMFVDYLNQQMAGSSSYTFKFDKYNLSDVLKHKLDDQIIYLAKPQTYMNKTGEAVAKLIKNFDISLTDLIVIHDDLDIPLGKIKIQIATGPKLHNGLESIENYLHTKDFLRVRIGVDSRTLDNWIDGETYALSNFKKEESVILYEVFVKIKERLSSYL